MEVRCNMTLNKEKNFASAVVYIENNENQIREFTEILFRVLDTNFLKYEVIFVNDCSSDKTIELIKEYTEKMSNSVVSILNMSYYHGLEMSMNAGVDLAIGDFVFEFDNVNVNYAEEMIMDLYREALKGFDIVSASSKGRKKMTSSLFYKIFNKYSNIQYALETETFRVLSRRAINRVHSLSNTIPYRKAVYANCGLELKNIKYVPTKNDKGCGSSKLTNKSNRNIASNAIVLYTDIAYKFTSIMTLVMMLITFIVGIYTVTIFIAGSPIAGWTTLMIFLAFGFFSLFAILSIILKYLVIILDLSFRKQKYVFESIEKLTR